MRKVTCLLLILVTLTGCMQWTASHLPLDQALSPDPGSKTIRVWLLDRRSIELIKPTVTDSTIAGISADLRAELVVIPRDSVRSVDEGRARSSFEERARMAEASAIVLFRPTENRHGAVLP